MRGIILLIFVVLNLEARVIIDHYNNSVLVPENITKIYAASPPLNMSLLAFNPDLVGALNSPYNDMQKEYVGSAFDKPVVGGFMGEGRTPNLEMLANLKPDVILLWGRMNGVGTILSKLKSLNIPVLMVKNDSIYDLLKQFELLGELSGDKKRADELIDYTNKTLSFLKEYEKKITKPTRYYFAEGVDGLNSECDGSFHLEPFNYAGGKNALDCKMSSNYGMEKISAESVLLSNPDVIVVMEDEFFKNIWQNPKFKPLNALKNKRVFLVPSKPFNYISRPPSFMRLLGIRWLIDSFYPQLITTPFDEQKVEFETIFFPQKRS